MAQRRVPDRYTLAWSIWRAGRREDAHVPYTGDSQMVNALLSGEIDIGYLTYAGGQAFVSSGKVRALAAGGPQRIKSMPQLERPSAR